MFFRPLFLLCYLSLIINESEGSIVLITRVNDSPYEQYYQVAKWYKEYPVVNLKRDKLWLDLLNIQLVLSLIKTAVNNRIEGHVLADALDHVLSIVELCYAGIILPEDIVHARVSTSHCPFSFIYF